MKLIIQAKSTNPEPPVPAAYLYMHVLDEMAACPFEPIVFPVEGGGEPLKANLETTVEFFEAHAQNRYALCPQAFQEVLAARLQRTLAESTISRTYGRVMSSVSEAWEEIEHFSYSITSETPPASITTMEQIVSNLVTILGAVRTHERELLRIWPLAVPADVAIGAERLAEWFTLFDAIADWDHESESAERLREAAQDFADYLHARFVDLHGLEHAKRGEPAEERMGRADKGSDTAISES
ncbi:hypothetical protein PsYK624_118180 [Phanerochaete sordida]|uniref:Uncharacterized protein n=1 Tax=Phanerochaete sordida TaxID=48140 RepID=A0A9P3GHC3_9APHY|nr:hypothetical protein PsYK624_118180 [Phanerochaete sordida]